MDIRIIETDGISLLQPSSTGESMAVTKDALIEKHGMMDFREQENIIINGSKVISGKATGVAIAT